MNKLMTLPFLFLALAVLVKAQVILDTDGNLVRANTEYYIQSAVAGNGGGLTLGGTAECSPDVVQALDEANNGLPLIFSPVNSKSDAVMTMDSNIEFSATSLCVQSTVWTVNFNSTTGPFPVTTGGVKGNPGRETLTNWFRIEPYNEAYKLVFCPGVCDTCRPYCGDLGIVYSTTDNTRYLVVLSGIEPFKVVFKKV